MLLKIKNRRVNKMMISAIVESKNFTEEDGKSIKRKYFGAVSSYGASIVGSGFDATTHLYMNKEYDTKLMEIPEMIKNILNSYDNTLKFEASNKTYILDAATALKLAMRTYRKVENDTRGGS